MTLQLDKNRIAIRERSYAEVLDLALRMFRVHAWPLAPLLAVGIVPMMLLNHWLLADLLDLDLQPDSVSQYALLMLLLVWWEAPLATAPATLYLGQAAFTERPDLRAVAKDFARSLGQLLLYQGLLRAWFAPWVYLNEVILLDRNPIWAKAGGTSTVRRARNLHRGEGAEFMARGMMWTAAGSATFFSLWLSFYFLRGTLLDQRDFDGAMYTLYFPLALWLVVGFFTVVRFLSYLDLRIRREGWEVELAMRAEQARLMRQWGRESRVEGPEPKAQSPEPGVPALDARCSTLDSCLVAFLTWHAPLALANAERSVRAGRESLDRWWPSYPWYDPQTDGVRRIEVSKPWDWSWLWDWLDFGWSPNWRPSWPTSVVQWLAWIVLIAVLAVVAYLLMRAYRRRWGGVAGAAAVASRERDAAADRRRIEALPTAARRPPSDLIAEALRLYDEGRYSEAIVYLFSHQLVQLDKHQLIHLEKGKTNRQYLRELGPRAAVRLLLEQTMVAFEDAFFGNYRLDRARFESCWSRRTDFEALLAEGAA